MHHAPNSSRSLSAGVFVISLKSDEGRRALFTKLSAHAKTPWEFFDAKTTLVPELDYNRDDAIIHKGRPLSAGELGCYASHYSVWQTILARGLEQASILEDDAMVNWAAINQIQHYDLAQHDVNYLKLFCAHPARARILKSNYIIDRYHLAQLQGYSYGAAAYAITRGGAEFFVDKIKKVRYPIDDALDRTWDHGMPSLCLFPFAATVNGVGSSIGFDRSDTFRIPPSLILRRFMAKATEKVLTTSHRAREHFNSITRRGRSSNNPLF